MKQAIIKCPICGKKLKLKSSHSLNFNLKLSRAENEIWCSNCKRWIKFNVIDKEVK